jgi:thiamine biosynthesis lipoprotein
MGTTVEIIIYVDSCSDSQPILSAAFAEFERLEQKFSYFNPESELSLVNTQAAKKAVCVSPEFFHIVEKALNYSLASKNSFSIMLAPLTQLWQKAFLENKMPKKKDIAELQQLNNSNLIELDSDNYTIFFHHPKLSLDLGGFIKGHAADCAKATLYQHGILNGLINAGTSTITAWGTSLYRESWPFGIKHLQENSVVAVVNLTNQAISTSGTNEKNFQLQNKFFSHLINPSTGYPVDLLTSATVICKSALEAEVISKMPLMLGLEETVISCENNGLLLDGVLLQELDEEKNIHLSYYQLSDSISIIS